MIRIEGYLPVCHTVVCLLVHQLSESRGRKILLVEPKPLRSHGRAQSVCTLVSETSYVTRTANDLLPRFMLPAGTLASALARKHNVDQVNFTFITNFNI